MSERRVLHVLPHGGAGAQTYIDALTALPGIRFETFELSHSRAAPAAIAAIAARRPALLRAARRADLIHAHGEVASLATLGLLARHRSVVTLHGLHLLRRLPEGLPARLGRLGARAIVAAADATVCVSQTERDELAWLPARLQRRLAVIRNGLTPVPPPPPADRARIRAALGLGETAVLVLYAGQLEARKDPATLVRAAAAAHRADARIVLALAGAGPEEEHLRSLGSAGVRLLGQRSDIAELLSAADVFVMPSTREGLSYAVLEAMAHGVATVVSAGAGNPEAVGEAGIVFGVGDAPGLAAILLGLAAAPERRRALGEAGRERIATQLSADQMVRATGALYDSVLTAPGRRGGGPPA